MVERRCLRHRANRSGIRHAGQRVDGTARSRRRPLQRVFRHGQFCFPCAVSGEGVTAYSVRTRVHPQLRSAAPRSPTQVFHRLIRLACIARAHVSKPPATKPYSFGSSCAFELHFLRGVYEFIIDVAATIRQWGGNYFCRTECDNWLCANQARGQGGRSHIPLSFRHLPGFRGANRFAVAANE